MKTDEFENLVKKAGFNKKEIETFKQIESLSEGFIQEFEDYFGAMALMDENDTPFILPPEEVQGQINFALTNNNIKVGINPEEPHMLIVGQTGSGKTTLILRILSEILKQ